MIVAFHNPATDTPDSTTTRSRRWSDDSSPSCDANSDLYVRWMRAADRMTLIMMDHPRFALSIVAALESLLEGWREWV